MTKEIDVVCSKNTLSRVDFQACSPQPLEDLLQVLDVLPRGLGPHNDVIDIASAERKVSQNVVHLPLEIGGRILKPEGNDQPLPQNSVGSPKCCFPPIFLSQRHLVVPAPQVQF